MMNSSTAIAPGAQPFFLPGSRQGILLIHGFGGTIDDYRAVGATVHSWGYSVLGMRVAGHGQGITELQATSSADWQASVDEALAELRPHCDQVCVVGVSFGGVLGLLAASRHQQFIKGVVTINSPILYRFGGRWLRFILAAVQPFLPIIPKFGLTPERKAQYAKSGSLTGWPTSSLRETIHVINDELLPVLPNLTQPVNIIAVAGDDLVDPKSATLLAEHLRSPVVGPTIIPGKTHRPFRDPSITSAILKEMETFFQKSFV